DNVKGTYSALVDKARVDGTLYGDTKLYYATDILKSFQPRADVGRRNSATKGLTNVIVKPFSFLFAEFSFSCCGCMTFSTPIPKVTVIYNRFELYKNIRKNQNFAKKYRKDKACVV
ncbi:MAG: hypothetical protein J6Q76_00235, partial [Clostridia bacterium]|nr:hypothetical protein [Clostridia bacterium]